MIHRVKDHACTHHMYQSLKMKVNKKDSTSGFTVDVPIPNSAEQCYQLAARLQIVRSSLLLLLLIAMLLAVGPQGAWIPRTNPSTADSQQSTAVLTVSP